MANVHDPNTFCLNGSKVASQSCLCSFCGGWSSLVLFQEGFFPKVDDKRYAEQLIIDTTNHVQSDLLLINWYISVSTRSIPQHTLAFSWKLDREYPCLYSLLVFTQWSLTAMSRYFTNVSRLSCNTLTIDVKPSASRYRYPKFVSQAGKGTLPGKKWTTFHSIGMNEESCLPPVEEPNIFIETLDVVTVASPPQEDEKREDAPTTSPKQVREPVSGPTVWKRSHWSGQNWSEETPSVSW